MTITISSTEKTVTLDGIACRVWEGQSEGGVKLHCFIPRVGVGPDQDLAQFERELQEQRAPSAEVAAIPFRMIL